jgi:hypothetical protein
MGEPRVGQRLDQAGGHLVDPVRAKPAFHLDRQLLGAHFDNGDERLADGQRFGGLQSRDDSADGLPELVEVAQQRVEPIDFRPFAGRLGLCGGRFEVLPSGGQVVLRHRGSRLQERLLEGLVPLPLGR